MPKANSHGDNKQISSAKKLKQAQLPFKVCSSPAAAWPAKSDKLQPVKKRSISREDPGGSAGLVKKPKKSTSESNCGEVSSSSDERRPPSPWRRPRALLDQFVTLQQPSPEVTTSCDLVDLTDDDKENHAEPESDVAQAKSESQAVDAFKQESDSAQLEPEPVTKPEEVTDSEPRLKLATELESEPATKLEPEPTTEPDSIEYVGGPKPSAVDVPGSEADTVDTADPVPDPATVSNTEPDPAGTSVPDAAQMVEPESDVAEAAQRDAGEVSTLDQNNDAASKSDASAVEPSRVEPDPKSVDPDVGSAQMPESKAHASKTSEAETGAVNESKSKTSAVEMTNSETGLVGSKSSSLSAGSDETAQQSNPQTSGSSDAPGADRVVEDLGGEVGGDAGDVEADIVVLDGEDWDEPADEDAVKDLQPKLPSTQGTVTSKKKTPKQKQREALRAKKEEEKQAERQRKEEEKERARKEKQEQKEKERKEKEEKKEKERLEKENERQEKIRQKETEKQKREDEKKRQKEQEKLAKDEKRKAEEEEEQKKLAKAKSMFSSFFVKKTKEPNTEREEPREEAKAFQQFRVKEDMMLAPGAGVSLSERQCSALEVAMAAVSGPVDSDLYLGELRTGRRLPQRRERTLLPVQKDVEIIEEDEEDSELAGLGTDIILTSAAPRRPLRYKLLMFHENRRPAYWGTWSKRSQPIKGRRPLGRDQCLNYDEDSADDWEEEDPNGESLSGSEKDVESEDEYDVDNEFFVPHGYLSDEEVKDEEEMMTPETRKAKLKEKGEEFDKQMKKKTTALKPRLMGCVWQDAENADPVHQQLMKLLLPFAARPLSQLPVPTVYSGEVESTPTASASPAVTPASAQAGYKFHKTFPEEALLSLAQLVHGSTRGKPLLIREFATFWRRRASALSPRKADPSSCSGTSPGGGLLLSKKKIEDKVNEIAVYELCTVEGPLLHRRCWQVRPELRARLSVRLPLPSQWKWITKTVKKVVSAAVSAAESPAEARVGRPRASVALITKFAKVVTSEEVRRELLSPPAKRKIVPTQLSGAQPPAASAAAAAPARPAQGITKFFKATPPAAGAGRPVAAGAAGTARRLLPTPASSVDKTALATEAGLLRSLPACLTVRRVVPTPMPVSDPLRRKVPLVSLPRVAPAPAGPATLPATSPAASQAVPAAAAGRAAVETIVLD